MARIVAADSTSSYDCYQMRKKTSLLPSSQSEPTDLSVFQIAGVTPTIRHVAKNTALFNQGDKPVGIFRLAFGKIKLKQVVVSGTEVTVHTVRPGDLFAESSIFSHSYDCHAIAAEDSEVLVYPNLELARQFKDNSDALWAFAAGLAQTVQDLHTRLELQQVQRASERVLKSLQLRCDSTNVWKADYTLKQFAEEIGLSQETLSRALATLEDEGHIVRRGKEIRLCEKHA